MKHILHIALNELRIARKTPSLYVHLILVASLTYMSLDAVQQQAAKDIGKLFNPNGPLPPGYISYLVAFVTSVFPVIIADIVARTCSNTWRRRIDTWAVTTSKGAQAYVLGRFLGLIVRGFIVFSSALLLIFVAQLLAKPVLLPPGRYGVGNIVQVFLSLLLPNILISGGILFAVGLIGRSAIWVYLAGVALAVGALARELFPKFGSNLAVLVLDSSGQSAVHKALDGMTPEDKLFRALPIHKDLIYNRVGWLLVAAIALLIANRVFVRRIVSRKHQSNSGKARKVEPFWLLSRSGAGAHLRDEFPATLSMTRVALSEFSKSKWFWIFLCWTVGYVLFIASRSIGLDGNFVGRYYPTLYRITYEDVPWFTIGIRIGAVTCAWLIASKSGILEFREVLNSTTIKNISIVTSQVLAVLCVLAFMMLMALFVSIGFQLYFGGLGSNALHVVQLFFGIHFITAATYGTLAVAVYAMVSREKVGHILILAITVLPAAVIFMATDVLGAWSIVVFGWYPKWQYSGVQGFLPSLVGVRWFQAYWLLGAVSLALLSAASRARSAGNTTLRRVQRIASNSTVHQRVAIAMGFAAFLVLGFRNYLQLSAREKEIDKAESSKRWAKYETRFKRFESEPLPRISAASIDYHIDSNSHSVNIVGKYTLHNDLSVPIHSLLVRLPFIAVVGVPEIRLNGRAATQEDPSVGVYAYAPSMSIGPGESIILDFRYTIKSQDVYYNDPEMPVFDNGAYILAALLPILGYDKSLEIQSDDERRRVGLSPRVYPAGSISKIAKPLRLFQQAALLPVDVHVFTDVDQVGLAQGALISIQSSYGRRISHFRSESNISLKPTVVSGNYSVKRASWEGISTEVYYNPLHGYNVDLIIGASIEALKYASNAFDRYRHNVIRIVQAPESPSAHGWAFETLIFISENSPFIARDVKDLDRLFFMTAHEVAHQWWGGRVVPDLSYPLIHRTA